MQDKRLSGPLLRDLLIAARAEAAPQSTEKQATAQLAVALGLSDVQSAQLLGDVARHVAESGSSTATAGSAVGKGGAAAAATGGGSATTALGAVSGSSGLGGVAGIGLLSLGKQLLIGGLVSGALLGALEIGRFVAGPSLAVPDMVRPTARAAIEQEAGSVHLPRSPGGAPKQGGPGLPVAPEFTAAPHAHSARYPKPSVERAPAVLAAPILSTKNLPATPGSDARLEASTRSTAAPKSIASFATSAAEAVAHQGGNRAATSASPPAELPLLSVHGGLPNTVPPGAEHLRREIVLVDKIRVALGEGNSKLALALCGQHLRRFPAGTLRKEVRVLSRLAQETNR